MFPLSTLISIQANIQHSFESTALMNTLLTIIPDRGFEYTKERAKKLGINECTLAYSAMKIAHQKGAEFGYNKANEWHYVKDGDLPRQDGNTCFSIEVLASNKKWVYYQFDSGKWFCGNKEVNVIAWKEIVFPEEDNND